MTDTHPHRVQLSRRKGWRMPADVLLEIANEGGEE
jgi:hypothetical protein